MNKEIKVDPDMTLEEYCAKLPFSHQVNKQLSTLQTDAQKAHSKYATTGELFTELIARATIDGSVNYRTIDIVKRQSQRLKEMELEYKTARRLAQLKTIPENEGVQK